MPLVQLLINTVTPHTTQILVNTGSMNGLLPDETKPLPEPMLTYPWGFVALI